MSIAPDPSNNAPNRVNPFANAAHPAARPHAPPGRRPADEVNRRVPTRFPVSEIAVSQADGEA